LNPRRTQRPETVFETRAALGLIGLFNLRGVTAVRLTREPATDSVDSYGRLLRYVIRSRDGLNINVHLVAVGAATAYFYRGRRGRYAAKLARLALRARRHHLGL
jgi:endonuclease YncB( thermonuclease family)